MLISNYISDKVSHKGGFDYKIDTNQIIMAIVCFFVLYWSYITFVKSGFLSQPRIHSGYGEGLHSGFISNLSQRDAYNPQVDMGPQGVNQKEDPRRSGVSFFNLSQRDAYNPQIDNGPQGVNQNHNIYRSGISFSSTGA
jgi:hypothetical protein